MPPVPPVLLPQACLQENPKSYSTWHHRKWVVLKGLADLSKELKLVGRCVVCSLMCWVTC
jgi:geranylgeranyl transferase type-2 subunit alpha